MESQGSFSGLSAEVLTIWESYALSETEVCIINRHLYIIIS